MPERGFRCPRRRIECNSAKKSGPAKVDAQFMAVAMAAYMTSLNLVGSDIAAGYGFNVTDTGIGTKVLNVSSNGEAFGVANDTDRTSMQLLLATDSMTDLPDLITGFAHIYDSNGNGILDEDEIDLRVMANEMFGWINEQGAS